MVGLDQALQQWLEEVKEVTELTPKEKQQITKTGAKVYAKALEEETRHLHYSHHEDKAHGHLADSVILSNANIDGIRVGSTVVGFDHYHATIARQLNNGTIKYPADHFIEKIQAENAPEVLKAMQRKYRQILKRKGG